MTTVILTTAHPDEVLDWLAHALVAGVVDTVHVPETFTHKYGSDQSIAAMRDQGMRVA